MSNPNTSPFSFGAGFEKDTRALLLALAEGGISRDEFRKNFKRLGVDIELRDPSALSLSTPQIARPEMELFEVPDQPDYVFDGMTGWVYARETMEHVGYMDPPEDGDNHAPVDTPELAAEFDDDDPLELPAGDEQVDEVEA